MVGGGVQRGAQVAGEPVRAAASRRRARPARRGDAVEALGEARARRRRPAAHVGEDRADRGDGPSSSRAAAAGRAASVRRGRDRAGRGTRRSRRASTAPRRLPRHPAATARVAADRCCETGRHGPSPPPSSPRSGPSRSCGPGSTASPDDSDAHVPRGHGADLYEVERTLRARGRQLGTGGRRRWADRTAHRGPKRRRRPLRGAVAAATPGGGSGRSRPGGGTWSVGEIVPHTTERASPLTTFRGSGSRIFARLRPAGFGGAGPGPGHPGRRAEVDQHTVVAAGRRASHTRRPWRISRRLKSPRSPAGTMAFRSCSILTGSSSVGEPEPVGQPADVGVDRQAGQAEGDAADDVGRLAADAGQRHEVRQPSAPRRRSARPGPGPCRAGSSPFPEEARWAAPSPRARGVGGGQRRRRRVAGEEGGRHHVHPLVGALGRQDGGDQQLERVAVVELAAGLGYSSARRRATSRARPFGDRGRRRHGRTWPARASEPRRRVPCRASARWVGAHGPRAGRSRIAPGSLRVRAPAGDQAAPDARRHGRGRGPARGRRAGRRPPPARRPRVARPGQGRPAGLRRPRRLGARPRPPRGLRPGRPGATTLGPRARRRPPPPLRDWRIGPELLEAALDLVRDEAAATSTGG